MINSSCRIFCCLASTLLAAAQANDYPFQSLPLKTVRIQDDFWSPRLETNRLTTVWYDFKKCEETGRIDNFAKAAKLLPGDFRGTPFDDSDVYKVIEGAAYTLALHPDDKLDHYLDGLIVKIATAQEPDGYLYTARTINPQGRVDFFGPTRWSKLAGSHELYNLGHLYEAAVAHWEATGKRSLLSVAIKSADLVCKTFGPGPAQLKEPPGHEEIEIGLVKLYRATGQRKYLDQAKFFCDLRGRADTHKLRGDYQQDHKPILEQDEAVGHSVRAGYFYSGVADVAALTGDPGYVRAIDRLWDNVVSRKMHLTGGIGASPDGEAFGKNYELPNDTAYLETCAAIANALWNERMFLLHGDSRYVDVLERVLYNGFLSGIALSGDRFFYPNPLESDGKTKFNFGSCERAPWFGCSCCPVNDVRFFPQLARFIYARRQDQVFVNLFIGSTARFSVNGTPIELKQETHYPWDGKVTFTIHRAGTNGMPSPEFALNLRIPGWATGRPVPSDLYRYPDAGSQPNAWAPTKPRISLNANPIKPTHAPGGFVSIQRQWRAGDFVQLELPMPAHRVLAHPQVAADRGRFAIERGPLVYCAEGADNDGHVLDKSFSGAISLQIEKQPKLLGGITTLKLADAHGTRLTCIPYYAWANRGANEMRVWFPTIPGK